MRSPSPVEAWIGSDEPVVDTYTTRLPDHEYAGSVWSNLAPPTSVVCLLSAKDQVTTSVLPPLTRVNARVPDGTGGAAEAGADADGCSDGPTLDDGCADALAAADGEPEATATGGLAESMPVAGGDFGWRNTNASSARTTTPPMAPAIAIGGMPPPEGGAAATAGAGAATAASSVAQREQ